MLLKNARNSLQNFAKVHFNTCWIVIELSKITVKIRVAGDSWGQEIIYAQCNSKETRYIGELTWKFDSYSPSVNQRFTGLSVVDPSRWTGDWPAALRMCRHGKIKRWREESVIHRTKMKIPRLEKVPGRRCLTKSRVQ